MVCSIACWSSRKHAYQPHRVHQDQMKVRGSFGRVRHFVPVGCWCRSSALWMFTGNGSGSTFVGRLEVTIEGGGQSPAWIAGGAPAGLAGRPCRDTVIHPPRNDVEVQMGHRLFRSRSAGAQDVDARSVQGHAHGCCHALDQRHRCGQDVGRGVKHARVMAGGDNQRVSRRERVQRGEGAALSLTGHPACGALTDELTEDAVHAANPVTVRWGVRGWMGTTAGSAAAGP